MPPGESTDHLIAAFARPQCRDARPAIDGVDPQLELDGDSSRCLVLQRYDERAAGRQKTDIGCVRIEHRQVGERNAALEGDCNRLTGRVGVGNDAPVIRGDDVGWFARRRDLAALEEHRAVAEPLDGGQVV